jgi:hypothetical protein
MEVTELITRFSFQGNTTPLDNYNVSLGDGIGLLVGFAAATAASALAVGLFASNVLESLQPLIDLNAATGVSVERIQELSFIASVSNSSTQQLFTSLEGLSTKIGEAAQKGSEEFSRLGISVRDQNGSIKGTEQILGEIGNRFKTLGLSLSEQKSIAESLGIDASLLTLLGKTSSELAKLAEKSREIGILNEEQVKQAQEYNDSLTILRATFTGFRRLLAVGVAPELDRLVKGFSDAVIANKDFVISVAGGTITALSALFDSLVRIGPVLAVVASGFLIAKVATLGFAASLALVFSPVVVLSGLIAGALLLLDDLVAAFKGEQSLIGDFFKEFLDFDIEAFGAFIVDGVKKAFDGVKKLGEFLLNDLMALFDRIGGLIPESLLNLFSGDSNIALSTNAMPIPSTFSASDIPDNSFLPSSSVQNSSRSVSQTVSIDVRTTDPERAGVVIRDTLQEQMTDAEAQSRRGGM